MISRKFFCSTERARCLYIYIYIIYIYIYIDFFYKVQIGRHGPFEKIPGLKICQRQRPQAGARLLKPLDVKRRPHTTLGEIGSPPSSPPELVDGSTSIGVSCFFSSSSPLSFSVSLTVHEVVCSMKRIRTFHVVFQCPSFVWTPVSRQTTPSCDHAS